MTTPVRALLAWTSAGVLSCALAVAGTALWPAAPALAAPALAAPALAAPAPAAPALAAPGLAAPAPAAPHPWQITTVAGGTGGPGPATQFAADDCAVSYSAGSLYTVGAGLIRRIGTHGDLLSPVAGSQIFGFDPGPIASGAAAGNIRIGNSCGVTTDHHGNMLFSDSAQSAFGGSHGRASEVIEAIPPKSGTFYGQPMRAGHVYRIAGTGTPGFAGDGGQAVSAELDGPAGLTVDAAGNIVVADMVNNRVRVICERTGTFYGQAMTAGDIYTVAGGGSGGIGDGGPATGATLALKPVKGSVLQYKSTLWPVVAIDAAGNIVLADVSDARIRVIARNNGAFYGQAMTAGHIYTVAGGGTQPLGDSGQATQVIIGLPSAVAVDASGNVIFSDPYNERVRVLAPAAGAFYGKVMKAGFVYTLAGKGFAGSAGDGGLAANAEFSGPSGLAVDGAGNVVIADDQGVDGVTFTDNMRLRVVAATTGAFYGRTMQAGHIYTVSGPRTSFVGNGVAATSGVFTVARKGEGQPPGGIAVSPSGAIGIADIAHSLVRLAPAKAGRYFGRRMDAGQIYTIAGGGPRGHPGEGGLATKAATSRLTGLAFDRAGSAVVATANRIRVVAGRSGVFYGQSMQAGHIYTIAGTGAYGGSGDGGLARTAKVASPSGITIDPHGNIVVCVRGPATDPEDGRIRIIAEQSGTFYGRAMTAGHIYPLSPLSADSLAVDAHGNVLLSTDVFGQLDRVEVIAEHTGTFYGHPMTAGQAYVVAGGGRNLGSGELATLAAINPADVVIDRAGNLVIGDLGDLTKVLGRVLVVAVRSGAFYGQKMTAGHIYRLAGNRGGGLGDGGPAAGARVDNPFGVAIAPSGAILVADGTRIREIHS